MVAVDEQVVDALRQFVRFLFHVAQVERPATVRQIFRYVAGRQVDDVVRVEFASTVVAQRAQNPARRPTAARRDLDDLFGLGFAQEQVSDFGFDVVQLRTQIGALECAAQATTNVAREPRKRRRFGTILSGVSGLAVELGLFGANFRQVIAVFFVESEKLFGCQCCCHYPMKPTMSLGAKLRRQWGLSYFLLVSFLSWIMALRPAFSGHYDIFSRAALRLWAGENPYGIESVSGYWFYSQSCGLFFFGPFAVLPYKVGLGLFLAVSWGVFFTGARRLLRNLDMSLATTTAFWGLIGSEMIGSLLNTRIEIVMTGVVLWVTALLLEGRWLGLAGLALAAVCDWKFTTIPVAGLLMVSAWFVPARRRFIGWFLFGALFWKLAPYAVLSSDSMREMNLTWASSLQVYMLDRDNWRGFAHIFGFLDRTRLLSVSFLTAQLTGIILGLLLGATWWSVSRRRRDPSLLLEAVAWGSGFALVISPLSQSAAYIGYAPLLIAVLAGLSHMTDKRRGWFVGGVAASWFFVSLAYSDVVTSAGRRWLAAYGIKPIGILILLVLLARLPRSFASAAPSNKSPSLPR